MDNNKFNNILASAQKLMLNEDFNRKVNGIAKDKSTSMLFDPTVPSNNLSELEAQAFGGGNNNTVVEESKNNEENSLNYNSEGANKMSSSILESFKKMPPLSGYNAPRYKETQNLTTKDGIEEALDKLHVGKQKNITEEKQYTSSTNSGIDYSLIKTIVEDCLRKAPLNESTETTFRGMRFIDGNKFQFIDNKGNLYEGVLKLKKKAKK